jgi:hypothetical protein
VKKTKMTEDFLHELVAQMTNRGEVWAECLSDKFFFHTKNVDAGPIINKWAEITLLYEMEFSLGMFHEAQGKRYTVMISAAVTRFLDNGIKNLTLQSPHIGMFGRLHISCFKDTCMELGGHFVFY